MAFFSRNMDYVLFAYGLSFVLLAVLCRSLTREDKGRLPWPWLGLFGLYHGFAKWLDVLAFSMDDSTVFRSTRLGMELISFVCLLEFSRRGFLRGRRPWLGPWFLPLLTLLAICTGLWDGLSGLNAASCYLLAFPGSLLAMLALAPAVPLGEDPWKRRGLIFSAASLFIFGLTEWVAPASALKPALWLNEKTFWTALGFPIAQWRALAILGTLIGLYLYRQRLTGTGTRRSRLLPWLIPALLVTLLTLGWTAAEWRGQSRDAVLQNRLLEKVSAVARAINPEDAKSLSFTPADNANPRFQRLRSQLAAARRLLACRSISSLSLRNGNLVFGPCTFSGKGAPAVGDTYRQASLEEGTPIFRGKPFVTGPLVIRGARVFSAWAPIRDLHTGQVLMSIGIEVGQEPWLSSVAQARLTPIALTMMILLALIIGIDMIRNRDDIPLENQGRLRYLEAFLVLFCGLIFTLSLTLLIHESELRRRNSTFDRLADSRTSQIRDEVMAIRADLQSLALFFQSSDFVSPSEFASFAGAIVQADAVEAFAWAPLVSTSPLRCAVSYIEPRAEHGKLLGYDLAADSQVEPSLREALKSRLWTATPAFPLPGQPDRAPVILAFQPASGSTGAVVAGVAIAIIRFDNLLTRAAGRSGLGEQFVDLHLADLTDTDQPRLIATHPVRPLPPSSGLSDLRQLSLSNLQPIFAFGRTFVVIANPTRAFWEAYPVHGNLIAGAGGVMLTLVLALFVALLRKRQWDLESEVRQRTEALRLSQENLAVTLHSIGDGVIATDARGVVRQINPAAERLTGWPAADAEGLPLHDIFHLVNSRTRQRILNPLDRVVAAGSLAGLANQAALIARDGSERQISDSAAPIRDASGATIGVVLVFSDVTQEYADHLKLEESELQYRLLAEHASDIIGRVGMNGRYLFLSPSSEHVLGYSPPELLGREMIEHVHPEDAGAVRAQFNKVLTEREGSSVVLRYRHKAGDYRWLEVSGRPVLDPGTQASREIIFVARDITERKHAEEDRLDMERRLLHAQKLESLGVLTGGIAHDFNNLLTAVLGNLELAQALLNGKGPASLSITQAVNAARRAADLTRQMLAYSGKGLFIVKNLNLNELVEENATMLKASISKTITLNLSLAPELPTVKADAGQIQQIVMNLITNASEAIGDRPGIVTLATGTGAFSAEQLAASRIPEKPAPGLFAWIEVSDNGCGMGPETMNRIFEPFFTTKFTGRGLGMSAVLGIMRGHHGALFLRSQPQHGSTIRVLFPLAEVPTTQLFQRRPPLPARPGPDQLTLFDAAAGDEPRGTVLIVDDEQIVQDICAAAVAFSGYRTLTASDGEEGVSVFREHAGEIVAVILDLTMPRMDGAAAFREMRRIRPDVRVILSSGHAEQEAFRRFDAVGVAGFLQKPYELQMLQAELDRVVKGRGA